MARRACKALVTRVSGPHWPPAGTEVGRTGSKAAHASSRDFSRAPCGAQGMAEEGQKADQTPLWGVWSGLLSPAPKEKAPWPWSTSLTNTSPKWAENGQN